MNPIDTVIQLGLIGAQLVAKAIKAIQDSKDLTAGEKKQHIANIMAEQDQDTKDLNAMPLPNAK